MMDYEEMQTRLSQIRPEKKDIYLARLLRGETIDLTKDEDLFFQVNKDRVSLNEFTERDKFKRSAEDMKRMKSNIDPNHKSAGGMRLIGEIPPEIYFARPEFSPTLSREERSRNIKKWLNTHSVFRISDKRL